MSIISQVYSLDVRLQAHFNHVLTLLYTGDLELPLLQCMYCRNSAETCEVTPPQLAALRGAILWWWIQGDGANYASLFFSPPVKLPIAFLSYVCLLSLPWCPKCITSRSSALC